MKVAGKLPPSIAVCIPSGDEMKADTAIDLSMATVFTASKGINVTFLNTKDSIISRSRNDLVELALKNEVDYLFWLDSDMRIPPDVILRLLRHQKAIVGCFYSQRIPPHDAVGTLLNKPDAVSGLHEALKLGSGCLLIKASVYREMPYPWYHEIFRWDGNAIQSFQNMLAATSMVRPAPEVLDRMIKDPGVREWLEANHAAMKVGMIGEDYAFCKKVRERGCKILVDLDLSRSIGHIGSKTFDLPKLQTVAAVA